MTSWYPTHTVFISLNIAVFFFFCCCLLLESVAWLWIQILWWSEETRVQFLWELALKELDQGEDEFPEIVRKIHMSLWRQNVDSLCSKSTQKADNGSSAGQWVLPWSGVRPRCGLWHRRTVWEAAVNLWAKRVYFCTGLSTVIMNVNWTVHVYCLKWAEDRPGKADGWNQFFHLPDMNKNQAGPI